MKISLGILREVKIDNNIDGLNIDTAGKEVRANKVSANTITEVVEDPVAVCLKHAGMTIETGVAKFSNFLGKKLDAIRRVAEDDRLVDLQFREQGVQAVNFLLFLNKSIVLCDTAQCEF